MFEYTVGSIFSKAAFRNLLGGSNLLADWGLQIVRDVQFIHHGSLIFLVLCEQIQSL